MTGESVRAILDGRKTQTRRLIRKRDRVHVNFIGSSDDDVNDPSNHGYWAQIDKHKEAWVVLGVPKYKDDGVHQIPPPVDVGDRLWVKETWMRLFAGKTSASCHYLADAGTSRWLQAADEDFARRNWRGHWRSPLLMPRWASRITLAVTRVRVERLQAICHDDIFAEAPPGMVAGRYQCRRCNGQGRNLTWPSGCPDCNGTGNTPREHFRAGWDAINGERAPWDCNPFVYVYDFRRLDHEVAVAEAS